MPSLATALAPVALSLVVVGHRGAPAELPESTLAGFVHALDVGAIELDVRATSDGVLVVHHDTRVSARCAPHAGERVRALTFAQLREVDCGAADPAHPKQRAALGAQIPTLVEVLALATLASSSAPAAAHARSSARSMRVFVELKADDAPPPRELARMLVAALGAARARSVVVVESFAPEYVAAVRAAAPEVARGLLCSSCDARTLDVAKSLGARTVSPAHARLTRAFVDDAHARGLGVYPWTANDPRDWARLRSLGVDGVVTDDPRALAGAPP